MLYPSSVDHLLIVSALLGLLASAARASAASLANVPANQYKDYRLYSVKMPDNYDLVRPANDESLSNEFLANEESDKGSANESTSSDPPGEQAAQQTADNLFYGLMSELIKHVPIDVWQLQLNHSLFTVSPDYYVQVEDYLLNNSLSFDVLDANIQVSFFL